MEQKIQHKLFKTKNIGIFKKSSYINNIWYLLCKYNLKQFINLDIIYNIKKKDFEKTIKNTIYKYHYKIDAIYCEDINNHGLLENDFKYNPNDSYNNKLIKSIDKLIKTNKFNSKCTKKLLSILFNSTNFNWYKIKNNSKILYIQNCPWCNFKWTNPIIHIVKNCKIIALNCGTITDNDKSSISVIKLIQFIKNSVENNINLFNIK